MRAGDLVGDYRIVRPLGQGGMATVFVAHDGRHDREVVLKALPPYLSSPEMEARFRREIQAIASLSHPNVVKVLDYAVSSTLAWYVMPFLPAEDLEKYARAVRADAAAPPASAFARLRGIVADVASALAHCHERGVFHRDIKPQNILVETDSRRGILSDFGLARSADTTNITKSREMVGTLRYMSPEMLAGGEVTGASDLYQLALVAYEVFAGQLPFTAANPYDQLKRLHEEPLPPVRTYNPQVSEELSELVVRALATEARERPPLAAFEEELRAAPLEFSRGRSGGIPRSVTAALSRSQELSAKLARAEISRLRRRRAAALVSGAALVIGGGAWLARGDAPRGFALTAGYQDAEARTTGGPRFRVEVTAPGATPRVVDAQASAAGWVAPIGGLAPGHAYSVCWVLDDGRRGPAVELATRPLAIGQVHATAEGSQLALGFETSVPVRARLLGREDAPGAELDSGPATHHGGTVALAALAGPELRVLLTDPGGATARLDLGPVALPDEVPAALVAALGELEVDRVFREVSSQRGRREDRPQLAARLAGGLLRRVMATADAFRPLAPLWFASPSVPLERRLAAYAAIGKLYHVEGILSRESIPLHFDVRALLGPLAPSPASTLDGPPSLSIELARDEKFRLDQLSDLEKVSSAAYVAIHTNDHFREGVTIDRDIRNVRDLKKVELAMTIGEALREVYFRVEINGRCRLLFFPPGAEKVSRLAPLALHHAFDPALLEEGHNRFRVEVHVVADLSFAKAEGAVTLLELRAQ